MILILVKVLFSSEKNLVEKAVQMGRFWTERLNHMEKIYPLIDDVHVAGPTNFRIGD